MLTFVNLLTFTWLAAWTLYGVYQLSSGRRYTVYILMVVVFLLCGLPLLLDATVGQPVYARFPGMRLAVQDETTSLLYCLYMALVPIILFVVGRPRRMLAEHPVAALRMFGNRIVQSTAGNLSVLNPALVLLALAPLFVLFVVPNPLDLLQYGELVSRQYYSVTISMFRPLITPVIMASMGACGILLLVNPRLSKLKICFILACMALAVWLSGKRHSLVIAMFILGYVLWYKGYLRGKRLFAAGLGALCLVGVFSIIYQQTVRGKITNYESYRLEFSRDDRIKMAIFAELNPDKLHILEHRGQSLLFVATALIPRSYWPEKPWPYSTYSTSAAFLLPKASPLGWGITTTWLEEAIANFSFVGFFLGPFILAMLCRFGDRYGGPVTRLLTVVLVSMLMAVHMGAFLPLAMLWIVAIMVSLVRNRRQLPAHQAPYYPMPARGMPMRYVQQLPLRPGFAPRYLRRPR